MPKDRFGEDIDTVDEKDLGPITYVIPPHNEHAKAITITLSCCLCRKTLEHRGRGWCYNCNTWPVNVTPVRIDKRGHTVSTSGWCAQCDTYTLTELDAQPGEWRDTGRYSRRLTKEEVKRLAQEVQAKLSGPGWPEVQVPLREDMIPRRWKNATLRVVGDTPLGYKIVLPEGGIVEQTESEVPF